MEQVSSFRDFIHDPLQRTLLITKKVGKNCFAVQNNFTNSYAVLLLVEVDCKITETISLRKIKGNCGEIKRMYVRPKFREGELGYLMIGEVIRVSKENGYSKLYLDTAHFMS